MGDLLSLLQDFDVANFLPAPNRFLFDLVGWVRLLVLAAPLLLLGMGIWFRYVSPQKPGKAIGFPLWVRMDTMKQWQYAQNLCNAVYIILGGVLSALMLVVSLFFSGKRALGMINVALICVIVELIVIVIVWFGVNTQLKKKFYR